MKQPRKLKRAEKEILSKNGLQASKWMYVSETEFYLKVWNKDTHTIKNVSKYPSKARRTDIQSSPFKKQLIILYHRRRLLNERISNS